MQQDIEDFLATKKAEGLAPDTIRYYEMSLKMLAEQVQEGGTRRWQRVKADQVDSFLAHTKERGLAWSSRERHVVNVRVFFRWMADQGKILSDPSRHVEIPRPTADDRPLLEPPLSEQQVADLFASMPRDSVLDLRNILVLHLLYSAGLRRAEALGLDMSDIDLRSRVLHVRKGKGSKPRTVPIMDGLKNAIKDYKALRRTMVRGPDHGALMLTQRGGRLNKGNIQAIFRNLNKRDAVPGRNLHPHLMRHSIAVHYLRGGMDIRYIQSFLGHDSLESTRIYLRLVPADLRKAYDSAMPEILVRTD